MAKKPKFKNPFKQPKTVVDSQGRTRVEKGHGKMSGQWTIGSSQIEQLKSLSDGVITEKEESRPKLSKNTPPDAWISKYGYQSSEIMQLIQFSNSYGFPSMEEFVEKSTKQILLIDNGSFYRYDSSKPLIVVHGTHLLKQEQDTVNSLNAEAKYEYIKDLRAEKLNSGLPFTNGALITLDSRINMQYRSFKNSMLFFMGNKSGITNEIMLVPEKAFVKGDIAKIKESKNPLKTARIIIKDNYSEILTNIEFEKSKLELEWEKSLVSAAQKFMISNKNKNDLLDIIHEPKVKVKE